MLVVIGVDPAATRLAAVVTVGDAYIIETHTMPKKSCERSMVAYRWMRRIVREHGQLHDVAVFIEQAVFGRGGAASTLAVGKIIGALEAGAMTGGALMVEPVNNQSWKSMVVGTGNAGKPLIKEHVRLTWPKLFAEAKGNQDVCDAACINRYGEKVIGMKRRVAARTKRGR